MLAWILAGMLLASPGESENKADAAAGKTPQQLRNAIRDVMAGEAQAKTPAAKSDAIRELCELYGEVLQNKELPMDEQLRLKALVWTRLTRVKADIKNRLVREKKAAAKVAAAGQQQAAPNASSSEQALALAAQLDAASQSAGGPAGLFAQAGGGFGGGPVADDNGDELVDLITRVISPDSWDVNGGPCSIVYYAQLRCLVVAAPDDTHHDMSNVLEQMRRLGP